MSALYEALVMLGTHCLAGTGVFGGGVEKLRRPMCVRLPWEDKNGGRPGVQAPGCQGALGGCGCKIRPNEGPSVKWGKWHEGRGGAGSAASKPKERAVYLVPFATSFLFGFSQVSFAFHLQQSGISVRF